MISEAGFALAALSAVYWVIAARSLHFWITRREPDAAGTLPPVTFFRPLKAAVPALREKLDTLVRESREEDQIVCGVEAESAEAAVCEDLRRAWPEREIIVVRCVAGVACNPKISKLVQMAPHARHEHWLLSDSEVTFEPGWLERFRAEWQGCDVLTAGYRFTNLSTWPQRLDAAATLLSLWPGLAVVRRYGTVNFTLGACTALRRDDLAAVGGWEEFGSDLAEDHRIGAALARAGRAIRLSTAVVTLDSDPLSWRDWWRHQRRVAVTYRVANPAGFAGMLVTHGVSLSLLSVMVKPWSATPWLVFAAAFTVRWATAWQMSRTLRFPIPRLAWVIPIASFVETLCWVLSWIFPSTWWAGRKWRITAAGKLQQTGAPTTKKYLSTS